MQAQTLEPPVQAAQPSINYSAHPTCKQFHHSEAYVRGLMGPIGSGKSVACCMEIFRRATQQPTGIDGKTRRSKWAAIRSTYPQLEQTTIATWMHWFKPITTIKYSSPITARVKTPLPDGTNLELEIIFLALNLPDDRNKLTSLELTGVWVNEAREIEWNLIMEALSRVGRYPNSDFLGRCAWRGMIMDTNPPDDDSMWYRTFEEQCPSNFALFRQPGALIPKPLPDNTGYSYDRNPLAENVLAHKNIYDKESTGYEYWERMLGIERDKTGKQLKHYYTHPHDWINNMVCGNYGICYDGKAVFRDMWDDARHFSKTPITIIKGLPIRMGWDFGFTHPACVIAQLTPKGQLHILREIHTEDCDLQQFIKQHVRPVLENEFQGFSIISHCDPAGTQSGQRDGESCYMELLRSGFPTDIAPGNNDINLRIGAVNEFLTRTISGEPAFLVDPSCIHIRKAFNGGYCFKRVQVGGKALYRDKPDKNEFSHTMDCIQYISLGISKDRRRESSYKGYKPQARRKIV